MSPTLSLIDIRSGVQLGSFLQAAGPRCVSCILCAALGWAGLGWTALGWLGYESVIQETYCHAAAGTSSQGGVATYNRSQHGAPIILPHTAPNILLPHTQPSLQPITCSSSGNVGKQIKLSCSSSSLLQPGADCCRPSCSATAADTTALHYGPGCWFFRSLLC